MTGSPQRIAVLCAGVWGGLFVVHSLGARWVWERDRRVEICIDGAQVEQLSDQDDESTRDLLEELRESGVSSVAIDWDPTRTLVDVFREWRPRLPEGLGLTLRPEPVPFSDWIQGWPRSARFPPQGPKVANVLFAGPAVMGFPDLVPVQRWLSEIPARLPVMEFGRQRGMDRLRALFPERVVRGHTLTEEEMVLADPSGVLGRLRRAVRERGVRFLYVRFFPGASKDANLDFVRRLAVDLRSEGYQLAPARPRFSRWASPFLNLSEPLRLCLAFLGAVGFPLWILAGALRRSSVVVSVGGVLGAGVVTGLWVAALMATPSLALGFSVFRGVKAAFLLPLAGAFFLLYGVQGLRRLWREPVTVGRLLVGMVFFGVAGYFVLRIGHGTVADASGAERVLRGHLETWLGVRPRFKEFLIGHPLLWFGFYLRSRAKLLPPLSSGAGLWARVAHAVFFDARPFILVGFIGPLSIVNTFCHAHTPLGVSLIRTVHGLWIGACLGGTLIAGFRWAETLWRRRF